MQWLSLDYLPSDSDFLWIQNKDYQTTSDGLVTYSFLDQINASNGVDWVVENYNSIIEEKLLLPNNSFGFWYFKELLDTLSYENYSNTGSNIYILPSYVCEYIQTQALNLNAFECKNLIIQIDKIIVWLWDATHLISAHNYIRSIIFTRLKNLVPNPTTPKNCSDEKGEVIYLWELLQWSANRTRFIPIENKNPAFTQKIDNYRKRVQHGIWNLTDTNFSPTFDIIFKICSTILSSKDTPDFPRDYIIEGINKFSLFECQYMLEWVNEVIYPEYQTSLVSTIKYVHQIKWYLEERVKEISGGGKY